jgi:hypothetical protein
MLNEIMKVIHKESELKVGAIRVLHRDDQIEFKGGKLDDYYIMGIQVQ